MIKIIWKWKTVLKYQSSFLSNMSGAFGWLTGTENIYVMQRGSELMVAYLSVRS